MPLFLELSLFALSLALRLWFSGYSAFTSDEAAIYRLGLEVFHGKLPVYGPALVYTGTQIPGSLQGLLSGLPLYLSGGHPLGAVYALAAWTTFGLFLLQRMYRKLFPATDARWIAAWILFAPWTFGFTQLINPNFALPYAVLFFGAMMELTRTPAHRLSSFLIGFTLVSIGQLHLSVYALLAVFLGALVLRWVRRVDWLSLAGGGGLGALTLIPYFLHRFQEATPTASAMTRNFALNSNFPTDLLAYFFRLLSFPTGDTVRFVSGANGYLGMREILSATPALHLVFWPTVAGALLLVLLGVQFFARAARPRITLPVQDRIVLLAVLGTGALFLFSVKGPSAHTIWTLFPFAFYPALRVGTEPGRARWLKVGVALTVSAGLAFTVFGMFSSPQPQPVRDVVVETQPS